MNVLSERYATDDLVLPRPGDGRTLAQRLTKRYAACITGAFMVPGREGDFAPLPDDLPPALAQALRTRGITQLYSHQAQAWAAAQSGQHVAIAQNVGKGFRAGITEGKMDEWRLDHVPLGAGRERPYERSMVFKSRSCSATSSALKARIIRASRSESA